MTFRFLIRKILAETKLKFAFSFSTYQHLLLILNSLKNSTSKMLSTLLNFNKLSSKFLFILTVNKRYLLYFQ